MSEGPRGLYNLFKEKQQTEHSIVVSDAFSKILIFYYNNFPLLCLAIVQPSGSLCRMMSANMDSFQELHSACYCWQEGQLSVGEKKGFLLFRGLRPPSAVSVPLGNPSALCF